MLVGDLDLERAFRDPAYRRKVTAFLDGAPGAGMEASEGGAKGPVPDHCPCAVTAPGRESEPEAGTSRGRNRPRPEPPEAGTD